MTSSIFRFAIQRQYRASHPLSLRLADAPSARPRHGSLASGRGRLPAAFSGFALVRCVRCGRVGCLSLSPPRRIRSSPGPSFPSGAEVPRRLLAYIFTGGNPLPHGSYRLAAAVEFVFAGIGRCPLVPPLPWLRTFTVIPKRAFENFDQPSAFERMLGRHIPKIITKK